MATTVKKLIPQLSAYIKQAMNEATVDEFNRPGRRLELHPSSFPYCGIRDLYEFVQEAPAPMNPQTFAGSYFTSVGTLVHTLIQTFMGMGGRVWGHWECSQKNHGCGYKFTHDISPYHDCPVCGHSCVYEEIGYLLTADGELVACRADEDPDNPILLDGHMDCLFEDEDGDFWVVDYKTTLLMKANKHNKDGKALANNATYRAQQRTYVTLTHRTYGKSHGIKPRGWILAFLPRDIPFQFAFHGEDVSLDDKKETWERICHDMEALGDVLEATCFDDISHLIETKPCSCKADYVANMENPYSECPLLPVCFNKKQLASTLRNEIDDNVLLPMRKTILISLKEISDEKTRIKQAVPDMVDQEDD